MTSIWLEIVLCYVCVIAYLKKKVYKNYKGNACNNVLLICVNELHLQMFMCIA
jgi:hypothetical protein